MVGVVVNFDFAALAPPPNHIIDDSFWVRISTCVDNLCKQNSLPCIFAGELKNAFPAAIDLGSSMFVWSVIEAITLLRLVRAIGLPWDFLAITATGAIVGNAIVLDVEKWLARWSVGQTCLTMLILLRRDKYSPEAL